MFLKALSIVLCNVIQFKRILTLMDAEKGQNVAAALLQTRYLLRYITHFSAAIHIKAHLTGYFASCYCTYGQ